MVNGRTPNGLSLAPRPSGSSAKTPLRLNGLPRKGPAPPAYVNFNTSVNSSTTPLERLPPNFNVIQHHNFHTHNLGQILTGFHLARSRPSNLFSFKFCYTSSHKNMTDEIQASLPYHEPPITTILIYTTFLLFLNVIDWAMDGVLHCGLVGQILVGVAWGTPGGKLLPREAEETIVQLGYLGLILIVYDGKTSRGNITRLSGSRVMSLTSHRRWSSYLLQVFKSQSLSLSFSCTHWHCGAHRDLLLPKVIHGCLASSMLRRRCGALLHQPWHDFCRPTLKQINSYTSRRGANKRGNAGRRSWVGHDPSYLQPRLPGSIVVSRHRPAAYLGVRRLGRHHRTRLSFCGHAGDYRPEQLAGCSY